MRSVGCAIFLFFLRNRRAGSGDEKPADVDYYHLASVPFCQWAWNRQGLFIVDDLGPAGFLVVDGALAAGSVLGIWASFFSCRSGFSLSACGVSRVDVIFTGARVDPPTPQVTTQVLAPRALAVSIFCAKRWCTVGCTRLSFFDVGPTGKFNLFSGQLEGGHCWQYSSVKTPKTLSISQARPWSRVGPRGPWQISKGHALFQISQGRVRAGTLNTPLARQHMFGQRDMRTPLPTAPLARLAQKAVFRTSRPQHQRP